jgi:fused signal recognition particle receptor
MMGLLDIFSQGLRRTRAALSQALDAVAGGKVDAASLEALEAAFLGADLGAELAAELCDAVKRSGPDLADAKAAARQLLLKRLSAVQGADGDYLQRRPASRPQVTLMVGVNGSGKTTTTGKLAQHFRQGGEKVLLGAADTFRAAASEQLALWAQRTGAELCRQGEGADPAAVAFDSVARGAAGGFDRVLIDTAGRLQTKGNLMEELKKIHRVCAKALPGAPHEVLLVLDATAGRNMLSQARLFHDAVPLSGLVLTKLDGTAKAGALLAVAAGIKVPVQLVGFGEKAEDLRHFEREAFVAGLFD